MEDIRVCSRCGAHETCDDALGFCGINEDKTEYILCDDCVEKHIAELTKKLTKK